MAYRSIKAKLREEHEETVLGHLKLTHLGHQKLTHPA